MKLGELWTALCAGDTAALDAAYLHRAHRERGRIYLKGRDDIAADWPSVLGLARECEILADLGDAAVIRTGTGIWHHWVSRESGRIAREVLIAEGGRELGEGQALVIEREFVAGPATARLAHLFATAPEGSSLRHVVSSVTLGGTSRLAIGEAVPNS